jgi:hypothetical protein
VRDIEVLKVVEASLPEGRLVAETPLLQAISGFILPSSVGPNEAKDDITT